MITIRTTPVLRDGVDIPDEVARMFNDVYRILREQQAEIDAIFLATQLQGSLAATKNVSPTPDETEVKGSRRKSKE